jgi:predicted nucleotidyltransferase
VEFSERCGKIQEFGISDMDVLLEEYADQTIAPLARMRLAQFFVDVRDILIDLLTAKSFTQDT